MTSIVSLKRELLELIESISSINSFATQYPEGTFAEGIGNANCYASYEEGAGKVILATEVMGTNYEGRSERIEYITKGQEVSVVREPENPYDSNNLAVHNKEGESLGNLEADVSYVVSPLIDAGLLKILNAKVSYVVPRSQRGARAKKAILYVEMEMQLEDISVENGNGCIVCHLGGDQVRGWAQKLTVYTCNIPMKHAKALFELYNRIRNEYDFGNQNMDLGYVGLDDLTEDILTARDKMKLEVHPDLDYSAPTESFGTFKEYIRNMADHEASRYGELVKYLGYNEEDCFFDDEFKAIFENAAVDEKIYYWLDQTRVDSAEWSTETMGGFSHWYEVMELYSNKEPLPFDLSDEDIVSIFGFNKFEAFADLSYGC